MPACRRCQKWKPNSQFSARMARGNWCRGCYISYYKEYNSNRVDIRDTAKRYQEDIRAHRAANKAALVRALGGACSLCGYSRSIAALDFDHVGPDGSPFSAHGKRRGRSTTASRTNRRCRTRSTATGGSWTRRKLASSLRGASPLLADAARPSRAQFSSSRKTRQQVQISSTSLPCCKYEGRRPK